MYVCFVFVSMCEFRSPQRTWDLLELELQVVGEASDGSC